MRPAVVSGIVTGWRVGQLLAIFFLCPDEQSQKSLQKPIRPSFLSLSKVANGGIELSREFGLLFWFDHLQSSAEVIKTVKHTVNCIKDICKCKRLLLFPVWLGGTVRYWGGWGEGADCHVYPRIKQGRRPSSSSTTDRCERGRRAVAQHKCVAWEKAAQALRWQW